MPKSGSTYLWRLLMEVTGFPDAHLFDATSFGHQDLSKYRLRRLIGLRRGSVSHIHLRATPENSRLIREYNLKPIVLTRNIFDIVPSIADHWRMENARGGVVASYVPAGIVERDQEAVFDFIIANCLPWYLGFLASWHAETERLQPVWLTYERFFQDQHSGLMRVLERCGHPVTPEQASRAIAAMSGRQTRKNKGVSGRGDTLLLPRQKDAIRQLAATWPIDPETLERVGL